ncbi:mesoderm-specific transcript protein-like protein, partial [Leptotrombidium deliense]
LLQSLNIADVHVFSHDYGDTVAQDKKHFIKLNNNKCYTTSEGNEKIHLNSVSMMNGGIFPGLYKPLMMQTLLRLPIIGTILGKMSNYYLFKINMINIFGAETFPTFAELYDMWAVIRYKDGYRIMGEVLFYMDERHTNEHRWIEALKQSKIKLHFIYGELDPINPPPFADYYKKIIPNPTIDVIKNCGHYPHLELPEVTFSLYLKFFNTLVIT